MPKNQTNVKLSYWEHQEFLRKYDLVVAGSGIVGLFSALNFKKKHKKARVLVIERGVFPLGASTKNAGFACFGSISELSADLLTSGEQTWDTVDMRWRGLQLLKKTLGEKEMDFHNWGGYELFLNKDELEFYADKISEMNGRISTITGFKDCYSFKKNKHEKFGFKKVKGMIFNRLEGQLNTGKMMRKLLQLARMHDIEILNGLEILAINDSKNEVSVFTSAGTINASKVILATNGFAKKLLKLKEVVEPARAQVLVAKPQKKPLFKGTFHIEEGFYYFRNINNLILLGGGRNLDFKRENTTEIAITHKIQNKLEDLLKTVIIPEQKFEITHRWAGIMGVGPEKKPIIKYVSPNVVAAVRMGGMGVAIGSLVGKKAAELLD